MAMESKSKAAGLVRKSGVFSVFASGIVVAGGIVGSADVVFHDSPPLAGWASSAVVSFLRFAPYRVTSVTAAQSRHF